jgi:branched-subunit amino acid aminotransferase/4-amino-4-deoxychorismate lyase
MLGMWAHVQSAGGRRRQQQQHTTPHTPRSPLLCPLPALAPAARQARVSVLDSGFMLGDGVWEGLRLHRGVVAFAGPHLARLYEGAKALDMDVGASPAQLLAMIYRCVRVCVGVCVCVSVCVGWVLRHRVRMLGAAAAAAPRAHRASHGDQAHTHTRVHVAPCVTTRALSNAARWTPTAWAPRVACTSG